MMMPSNKFKDHLRQGLNLFFALTQFIVPEFSKLTGIGRSISDMGSSNAPEMPMGYAFSIWFLIFSLALYYAVYQARPSQRNNPLCRKIGFFTAGTFCVSSVWMLCAQVLGDGWHLVALILVMQGFALTAFFGTVKSALESKTERWVIMPMTGLFAGWLTLAVFLNATSTITALTGGTLGFSHSVFALLTILPAAAAALFVIVKSKGNLWYTGAVLWGLVAIVLNDIYLTPSVFVGSVVTTIIVIVLCTLIFTRSHDRMAASPH